VRHRGAALGPHGVACPEFNISVFATTRKAALHRPPQVRKNAEPTPRRPKLATSTSLAIPATISFALFAQLILVEARLSQFPAHIPPSWSLTGFPVCAAISFAPLP
jgi:hypothetical protein